LKDIDKYLINGY